MPNLRGKTWTTTTPATVGDAQYWEDHLISDADATKIASSVQSVNNTPPDAQGNVDIVALPSGGTLGQVLTKQSSVDGDADWEDPASSGHTIVDEDDTDMPYRTNLQFLNAEVTDDSVNDATVVDCKGSKGDPGDAATITVGTVTTLPAGSSATVVNSGTTSAAVFDFGIPKGEDGTGAVDSVNGQTGVVVLDAEDVGAIDTAGDGLAKEGTTIALDLGMLTGSNLTKAVSGKDIKDALDAKQGTLTFDNVPTNGSNNPVKSDGIYDALAPKVSESLLKSTVGWVGKNKLPITIADIKNALTQGSITATWNRNICTINGIDYTIIVNNAGYVTEIDANGTASADAPLHLLYFVNKYNGYILNGCPSGASGGGNYELRLTDLSNYTSNLDVGSGITIDKDNGHNARVLFTVKSGKTVSHIKIYPMLRDASITDSTFEPYHPSVEECKFNRAEQRVLGAKNLLKFDKKSGTSPTGITYSIDENGCSLDGTVTNAFNIEYGTVTLQPGNYVYTDEVVTSDSTYFMNVRPNPTASSGNTNLNLNNKPFAFSLASETTLTFTVYVRAEQSITNLLFKPMLRLASDPDDTYVPYAMTNRELTQEVTSIGSGLLPMLMFDKIYGTGGNTINIDTLNNSKGYILRVQVGADFSGTFPTTDLGTAGLIWGFSIMNIAGTLPIYGVQCAIGFSNAKIAIRVATYNESGAAWGAWRFILSV